MLHMKATVPPPSHLTAAAKSMLDQEMTCSLLIQKELAQLDVKDSQPVSYDASDPIDESLTLFELFLVKITSKKYAEALQVGTEILKTDPRNPLILEYVPVLKEKLLLDLQDAAADAENNSDEDDACETDESTDGSELEDDSESGSDSDMDTEDSGTDGATGSEGDDE
ncbi:hypothetical protein BJ741DRAFT_616491 [Chytriomyces cf. hyalinus JEL632]|nr:hypothetical protein BJ741DRAFT_616491 [Chytriomyces cf. hyalinus JEL632]